MSLSVAQPRCLQHACRDTQPCACAVGTEPRHTAQVHCTATPSHCARPHCMRTLCRNRPQPRATKAAYEQRPKHVTSCKQRPIEAVHNHSAQAQRTRTTDIENAPGRGLGGVGGGPPTPHTLAHTCAATLHSHSAQSVCTGILQRNAAQPHCRGTWHSTDDNLSPCPSNCKFTENAMDNGQRNVT